MDNINETLQNNEVNIYDFVLERRKAGDSKETIVLKLIQHGYDETQANQIVDHVEYAMTQQEEEKVQPSSLIMAILGGVAAAIVGGALWYWIIIGANRELGILAWGIGWVCGFAVAVFARGQKGVSLQVIASACSVFGILLGKYLAFTYFSRQAVLAQYGQFAADTVTVFSTRVLQVFFQSLGDMVSAYDILWIVLAVGTAWKIAGNDLKQLLKKA